MYVQLITIESQKHRIRLLYEHCRKFDVKVRMGRSRRRGRKVPRRNRRRITKN